MSGTSTTTGSITSQGMDGGGRFWRGAGREEMTTAGCGCFVGGDEEGSHIFAEVVLVVNTSTTSSSEYLGFGRMLDLCEKIVLNHKSMILEHFSLGTMRCHYVVSSYQDLLLDFAEVMSKVLKTYIYIIRKSAYL